MILPVIMAGGSGSRLWPLSRQLFPKQFLPLVGDETMLQSTCSRLEGLAHHAPLLICGEDHRFTVAEQLRTSGHANSPIILEPAGRNTAPAVALAALHAIKEGDDPVLLVLAADHVIADVNAFQASVSTALPFAEQGKLVTFGIVPTAAETGYGYIQRGAVRESGAFDVAEFVEKPDLATAEQYLSRGEFYWNSGMFMFKASRYLEVLKEQQLDIYKACEQAMTNAAVDSDFIRPDKEIFLSCPDDSIDYAVMEPLCSTAASGDDVVVVPMECGWSDVGSWSALWDVSEKDENGNTCKGDVLSHDTQNCFIQSDGKLIATVGLDGIVVVESDDAIMVAAKDRVQDVKKIVETLKAQERSEATVHRKVYRPWGFYDSIDQGERFQVKRIVVSPGAQLSLQMHHHRAEHWIVVSGTAKVTKGDEVFLLAENESTYIPLGVTHRLENSGSIELEMIEVQSGSYLGEDDIVRFEDNYNRE
ncbi:MAG: mannose-1-phosphate guanylyltransferase/mannose-6-phosphate isomerase [Cycloclasticus sp. symbiont of Bathymodiolus heckerae]|nr:MAG: mannose-1-phosphate guanylyltransferase/mannose-6-phosphate isomerase [Cycloclasticus sp. symbiont of Bathymodiolus heckerae]